VTWRSAAWDGDQPTIELPVAEPFRPDLRDLLSEALVSQLQRPGRSALTILGTVLGVGMFVAVLGLTSTADARISEQVALLEPTTVTVEDVGATQTAGLGSNPPLDLPADADSRIDSLHGVVSAGVYWTAPLSNPVINTSPAASGRSAADVQGLTVFAASPGTLSAMQPTMRAGTLYNAFHQKRAEHVAVLGAGAARRLGITNLATQPAVFIDDTAFTVVGIISDAQRLPKTLQGVLIPSTTAEALYGPPGPHTSQGGGARMLIQTRVGAADQVAHEAALALDPARPDRLRATAPPDSQHALRDAVNADLSGLFLLLALICLVIGAASIATTTVAAVLERTGEIGLRRALGARRRSIAAQFLAESTLLGTLGALLGAGLGVATVLITASARDWTPVLDPMTVLPAPLIGTAAGLAAGLYPAIRAADIEPIEALRH
jgi:putative ABC transport system permease protein